MASPHVIARLAFTLSIVLALLIYGGEVTIVAQRETVAGEGTRDTAWSPDGQLLAVANPDGKVNILDSHGETVRTFSGHERGASSVSWSPDGKLLASSGYDDLVRIWNMETGELETSLKGFIDGIDVIAWSPLGTRLIGAGFDSVKIWDTVTWTELPHPWSSASIIDIDWSPDGKLLAISGINETYASRPPKYEEDELKETGFLELVPNPMEKE